MHRAIPALLWFFCSVVTRAEESHQSASLFENIDRSILHEPNYESTPKYGLLLIGARGESKVWMVEDGRRLYLDKNGNGDLTDDGPPIEPSEIRKLSGGRWDFNYLLDRFTTSDGSHVLDFNLRRWNYGAQNDRYGLSLALESEPGKLSTNTLRMKEIQFDEETTFSLSERVPMYAGWFGSFWASNPADAPIVHFGGPLTPKLLRAKEFVIGSEQRRFSLAFINPGSSTGTASRLSIDALPEHVIPEVTIQWPTDSEGQVLKTSHDLTSRCCYWEFYTTKFELPKDITTGTAQIFIRFPQYELPIELTTTTFSVPVLENAIGLD